MWEQPALELISSSVRKEAYLNEYKGYLFEFLVGRRLAQHFQLEAAFLRSLCSEEKKSLAHYQRQLANLDHELLHRLPFLAQSLGQVIISEMTFAPQEIKLVGKQKNKAHHTEADLCLIGENQKMGLGLKLCKFKSYVNTKSGGLRSFLSQYFPSDLSEHWQKELNQLVSASFQDMGEDLYQLAGLNWSGQFGPEWEEAGYSSLPGPLPGPFHHVVGKAYARQAQFLQRAFIHIQQELPELFRRGLEKLCGLSQGELWQAICFHQNSGGHRYQLAGIELINPTRMASSFEKIQILPYQTALASFEIATQFWQLQIRAKPMNVFTQSSMKVNCSLKFK